MSIKLHILFLASWFPSRAKPTSGDFVQRHAEAVSTKHNVSVIHVVTDENLHAKIEIESKIENNYWLYSKIHQSIFKVLLFPLSL